ncbi:NAD(P)-binding domain-containing protein [Hydrogenophaga crocea]|uniref:NAD(P)-binding domain-containing protein n=1 Tax=Hydrogenophaga crocea TaxID=2716225 RepID=A0A6G8IK29_9BURK|nr:NAD(P)-binding domain-containing protein [Hydrogenophaga crocea]QIM53469.1 NAD(P)-binding domain-containing protein [Hydrogenophaga crocea]
MTNAQVTTAVSPLPVAVIGAGPVGLAAAAHLHKRGLPFVLFEGADRIADHLASVAHVRLFSPWRFNVDASARELLAQAGIEVPSDEQLPTAGELIEQYLRPLSELPAIASQLHLSHRVLDITRRGHDKVRSQGRQEAPFLLRVATPAGEHEWQARAIVDATGTWGQPNPLGVHGLPARGEHAAQARIAHGMPDILGAERRRYAGKRTLVVGAGHSAAGNLLALTALARQAPGTQAVWAVRGTDLRRLYGGARLDGLSARGTLGQRLREEVEQGAIELHLGFGIADITLSEQGLLVKAVDDARAPIEAIDQLIAATGSRPDLSLTRELRVRLDPWLESTDALAPLIDPNEHSCGTVRPHGHRELAHQHEPGYYAIGAKSYGRAPNFLLATGYEQARSVAAALAGDLAAADDVRLELPQTGVCSTDLRPQSSGAASAAASPGCCGGPPQVDTTACCVRDELAKVSTGRGCGCGTATDKSVRVTQGADQGV